MAEFLALVITMWFLHFVFDFPLQGDFLARAKNRHTAIPGVPWGWPMFAHVFMHAVVVTWATGSILCGVVELAMHTIIDIAKCEGWHGFTADQTMHLLCKVFYACLVIGLGGMLP